MEPQQEQALNALVCWWMMQGMSLFAQEHDYFIMYAFGKTQDEEKCIKEFSNGGIVDGIIMLKTEVNDQTIKYLFNCIVPYPPFPCQEKYAKKERPKGRSRKTNWSLWGKAPLA